MVVVLITSPKKALLLMALNMKLTALFTQLVLKLERISVVVPVTKFMVLMESHSLNIGMMERERFMASTVVDSLTVSS